MSITSLFHSHSEFNLLRILVAYFMTCWSSQWGGYNKKILSEKVNSMDLYAGYQGEQAIYQGIAIISFN